MFTGIVEELGRVVSRNGARLRIEATKVLDGVQLGDSTAVNGCCLTVVDWEPPVAHPHGAQPGWWEADVSEETYRRTNLGSIEVGDAVNLERPVRLSDRLGGHLVQGHVDAVGTIVAPVPDLVVRIPQELCRYLVDKGSVTVDGVSLTVVEALEDGFSVAVIPHTSEVTTLGSRGVGSLVNIEVDVTAKYIERLIAAQLPASTGPSGPPITPIEETTHE